jgi:hypothetical protein
MRRLLLATVAAVVIAAPVSAAWGGSSSTQAPASKTHVTKTGSAGGESAPNARSGGHGDGQCPFAEAPAI